MSRAPNSAYAVLIKKNKLLYFPASLSGCWRRHRVYLRRLWALIRQATTLLRMTPHLLMWSRSATLENGLEKGVCSWNTDRKLETVCSSCHTPACPEPSMRQICSNCLRCVLNFSIFADDVILFPLSDIDLQLALDRLSTACEAEDRGS